MNLSPEGGDRLEFMRENAAERNEGLDAQDVLWLLSLVEPVLDLTGDAMVERVAEAIWNERHPADQSCSWAEAQFTGVSRDELRQRDPKVVRELLFEVTRIRAEARAAMAVIVP